MTAEWVRNNYVFEYEVNHPIELYREKHFKGFERVMLINAFHDRIFISEFTYLACIDFESGDIVWERKSDSFINKPVCVEEENVFATVDGVPACLDIKNGDIRWKAEVKEELLFGVSENFLFAKTEEDDKNLLQARSKKDGALMWTFDKAFDTPMNLISADGLVLINTREGIHALKEENGELLWELRYKEFHEKYNTGAVLDRLGIMGTLIDGILYFSQDKDLLFAVDAASGELIWQFNSNTPTKPLHPLYKDGRLYFHLNQSASSKNSLFCVDPKTGKKIFQTEENFTPQGCNNPRIVGKYLIGGNKQYLSFFDLEKEEFVWRYKDRKKRVIFGGGMFPYKDQLVFCRNNTLFWFRSKS